MSVINQIPNNVLCLLKKIWKNICYLVSRISNNDSSKYCEYIVGEVTKSYPYNKYLNNNKKTIQFLKEAQKIIEM